MIVVLGSWWHSPVIPTVSFSTSRAWLSNPILAPFVVDVSLDDTLSDCVWSQCEEAFVFLTENCLFLTCALVLIGAFLCSLSSPAFQMLSPCQRFPPMIPSLWWLLPLFCRNLLTSWNLISQCSLLCYELLEWVPENPGLCLYLLEVSEFILHLDICSTLDRFWSRMRDKDLIPFFTQYLIYSVSFAESFKF